MTGPMFPFITDTWNPIAGGFEDKEGNRAACLYLCRYCWARKLLNDRGVGKKKYAGPYRIHQPVIGQKFKPGSFVFTQDMSDIGYPDIPEEVIVEVFKRIKAQPKVKFLLLTKNDDFYSRFIHDIPDNCVCGITVETDMPRVAYGVGFAPDPIRRIDGLIWAKCNRPDLEYFVCIEPILRFNRDRFADRLRPLEPWRVAVGYDNYKHQLDEPSLVDTKALIADLETFTTVVRKTIRFAWWEKLRY